MKAQLIELAITWCGIGHIGLCLGSLFIPKALQWKKNLASVQALIRQMFWTYAAYILVINLSFGIVSVFASGELLNGSFLAKSVTFFIGIYWFTRICIQFFYFDKTEAPKGILFIIGEVILVVTFAVFSLTYFAAFLFNNQWI